MLNTKNFLLTLFFFKELPVTEIYCVDALVSKHVFAILGKHNTCLSLRLFFPV